MCQHIIKSIRGNRDTRISIITNVEDVVKRIMEKRLWKNVYVQINHNLKSFRSEYFKNRKIKGDLLGS